MGEGKGDESRIGALEGNSSAQGQAITGYYGSDSNRENAPSRKRQKILDVSPPQVEFNTEWSWKYYEGSRRFMVLTPQSFHQDLYRHNDGLFMGHIRECLTEARDDRAVIDMPYAGPSPSPGGEDRFFGNQFAGEALLRVGDVFEAAERQAEALTQRLEKAEDEIRDLRKKENAPEHLGIPDQHRANLMAKNLHMRYRNMWQMAANLDLIPPDMENYRDQKGRYAINVDDYGGFRHHKDRYDLCTALAHAGSLRDDLVAGTSQYFHVWHTDVKDRDRSRLFRNMFEEVYSLDYDTAQWIVDAADKGLKQAQDWIRLIDRFRWVIDCSHKHASHKEKDSGNSAMKPVPTSLQNYATAQSRYKTWVKELKTLIANQKLTSQQHKLSQSEKRDIDEKTLRFYKEARRLLTSNWDRIRYNEFWKPTESLQKDYNSIVPGYDPFSA